MESPLRVDSDDDVGEAPCDTGDSFRVNSDDDGNDNIVDHHISSSSEVRKSAKRARIAPVNRAGPSNIGVMSHCNWCVQQLQDEGLMDRVFSTLRKLSQPTRCGSLCSGIDTGIYCLLSLQHAFGAAGFQVDFEHTFSCDLDETIRQKLVQAYPGMRNLFQDVMDVATGTAFCEKLQHAVVVPSVDILIVGFPCVDLSSLSNTGVSFDDLDSSSGGCYRAVLKYITKHKPSFIILENVLAVFHRKRNALKPCVAQIIDDMRSNGYVGGVQKVNAFDFGLPQRRHRAYMLFSRLGASSVPASKSPWFVPDANAIRTLQNLERFKCDATPLAYFLTDACADDKYFQNKPVHEDTPAKMSEWVKKANLLEADIVALETSPSFLPTVRSHRVRWLIAFHLLRLKKAGIDATSVPIVLQVDQRADRVPCVNAGPPAVPCVTTKGVYYVTSLNKFLSGEELLQVQGLSLQDQVKLGLCGMGHSLQTHLAGNAFSSSVFTSAFLALLLSVS